MQNKTFDSKSNEYDCCITSLISIKNVNELINRNGSCNSLLLKQEKICRVELDFVLWELIGS